MAQGLGQRRPGPRGGSGELAAPVGARIPTVRLPPAVVVLPGGQIDGHDAAPVPLAARPDLAPMLAHDLVRHRQPHPRAIAPGGREGTERRSSTSPATFGPACAISACPAPCPA